MKTLEPFFILSGSASILYGVCSMVLTFGKLKKDRNNVESIEHLIQKPEELVVLKRPAWFIVIGFFLFMLLNFMQKLGL